MISSHLPRELLMGALCACFFVTPGVSSAADDADSASAEIERPGEQVVEEAGEQPTQLMRFSVLGDARAARAAAGSAHFIGPEELETFSRSDVLRVLREVPGIYLQEEEGYGLRPNIGIRGSGLDRSSRITLLEDGVLIAPAPYAAPSAYYFPGVQRMHAIEVIKGPAAVAMGPRTTGGAMNMLSTPVPDRVLGSFALNAGQDGMFNGLARIGDAGDRYGWLLEANHQQTNGFKTLDSGQNTDPDSGYELQDYVGKVQLRSAPGSRWEQTLEIKLGYWQHDANETYTGLTDADFAASPYRRYAGTQLDHLGAHHSQYQASWALAPANGDWDLSVVAYRNDFHRNWYKLDSVDGVSISNLLDDPLTYAQQLDWLRGAADSPDDTLKLRNNNRTYYAQGAQAILNREFRSANIEHQVELGIRIHEDEEDRLQDDDLYRIASRSLIRTTDGAQGSQANRVSDAHALALHLGDRIEAGDFSITPGLRYERISLRRKDYATGDPSRTAGPTRVQDNDIDVWVPGVGMTWQASDTILLIGGVNRGFNPPAPGSSAGAEKSVNVEAGIRYYRNGLSIEAVGFASDYQNLVGTCTASTGGNCTIGDQFDGGQVSVRGLEFGGRYRFVEAGGSRLSIPLSFNLTWTPTADFDNSFVSGFEPWGDVQAGDRMPYVPTLQTQVGAGLERGRWTAMLQANYQGKTRTVAGRGAIPADESTDNRIVLDLAMRWQLNSRWTLTGRVENLLDEVYNVARRPAGMRPGMPRTVALGFRYEL